MANKTVHLKSPTLNGQSNLTMILTALTSGAISNGSGDTLTAGSNGAFSCIVTEAITGWFYVAVYDGTTVKAEGGMLYFPSDVVGDYVVDDPTIWTAIKAKTDQLTFTIANQVDANGGGADVGEIIDAFEAAFATGTYNFVSLQPSLSTMFIVKGDTPTYTWPHPPGIDETWAATLRISHAKGNLVTELGTPSPTDNVFTPQTTLLIHDRVDFAITYTKAGDIQTKYMGVANVYTKVI